MNTKYILIILGEPYSTFSEIVGKYFKKNRKLNNKIVLVGCKSLLQSQLKDLNCLFKLNEIRFIKNAKKNVVNIINVKFDVMTVKIYILFIST